MMLKKSKVNEVAAYESENKLFRWENWKEVSIVNIEFVRALRQMKCSNDIQWTKWLHAIYVIWCFYSNGIGDETILKKSSGVLSIIKVNYDYDSEFKVNDTSPAYYVPELIKIFLES